eukprot:1877066-Rhodomonas_salina.1
MQASRSAASRAARSAASSSTLSWCAPFCGNQPPAALTQQCDSDSTTSAHVMRDSYETVISTESRLRPCLPPRLARDRVLVQHVSQRAKCTGEGEHVTRQLWIR